MSEVNDGKLTEEQRELVKKWVTAKLLGNKATCPICHTSGWDLLEHFIELRPFQSGAPSVGGAIYPNFALVCKQCGYTALVNAITTGLLPQDITSKEGGSNVK